MSSTPHPPWERLDREVVGWFRVVAGLLAGAPDATTIAMTVKLQDGNAVSVELRAEMELTSPRAALAAGALALVDRAVALEARERPAFGSVRFKLRGGRLGELEIAARRRPAPGGAWPRKESGETPGEKPWQKACSRKL